MQSKLEGLHREICYFSEMQIENKLSLCQKYDIVHRVRFDIYSTLKEHVASIGYSIDRIALFGSVLSKTSKFDSDLDIVVCIGGCPESEGWIKRRRFKNELLSMIHRGFTNNKRYQNLQHASSAVVPIVCCETENIGVDISIHCEPSVPLGYIASIYLQTVVKFYPKFPVLLIFIKGWLRSYVDNGEFVNRSIPNSYALSLLIIQFLQSHEIIPNIHKKYPNEFDPKKFKWGDNGVSDEEILSWKKDDTQLSKMFIMFLEYYTKYPLNDYFVDMKEGIVGRRNDRYGSPQIRDPFDPHNPCRSMFTCVEFQKKLKFTLSNIFNQKSNSPQLINVVWKHRQW